MMEMPNNITVCDKCGHEFTLAPTGVKEQWLSKKDRIREQYFLCPECNEKYTVLVTDITMRNLIVKHKKLTKQYNKLFTARRPRVVLEQKLNEIQANQKVIHKRADWLKAKWLHDSNS